MLLTGVRAVATGRRWFGNDRHTGRPCGPLPAAGSGPHAFGALDPSAELPRGVGLLTVEGPGEVADRIPATMVEEFPELFAPEPTLRPCGILDTLTRHHPTETLWPA